MESQKINQKEYLKRYLCKDADKKKKKHKKKLKVGTKTVQLIDDDVDVTKIKASFIDEEISILNTTEDAPQIVGIIDERGPIDFENKQKWKIIADDGTGDISISKVEMTTKTNLDKQNCEQEWKKSDKNISSRSDEKKKSKKKHNSSDSSSSSDSESETIRSKVHSKKKVTRDKESDDSDMSPPRDQKREKYSKGKKSTSAKNKRNIDSELSPRRTKNSNSDLKNSKSRRHKNYDSDTSPPRHTKHASDSTPPRKKKRKNDSDSDLSPPRISKSKSSRHYDSDLSPPRVSKSKNSKQYDSDLSPPRVSKSKNSKYDSDLSPCRQSKGRKNSSKSSDSRQYNKMNDSDSDLSPPRNHRSKSQKHYDSDLSPPRHSRRDKHVPEKHKCHYRSQENNISSHRSRSSRWGERSRNSRSSSMDTNAEKPKKMKKTLDGTSAGLQNLRSLKEEEEAQKKREAETMKKMSREMSGYGQFAVMRDRKTGRRRDLEREAAESREKQKIQDEIDEKYAKWGKGLKQTDDYQDRVQRDLHEMNKPLARYADDEDLEQELKSRDRQDDPMLAYIKDKEIKEGKRAPDKPSYEGSFMPNRFGIKPGCRWDGVDRSNGYEKKWFENQNAKKATEEEAYKWSTADM